MKKTLSILAILIIILVLLVIILNKKEVPIVQVNEPSPEPVVVQSQPIISIAPTTILPGDPILITIISSSTPTKILFDTQTLPIFEYQGNSGAFVGIDFNEKNLTHTLAITFSDGSTSTQKITLTPREKREAPLGIPDNLGGNTPEAEKALLANLAKENTILNNVKTATTTLWKTAFIKPLTTLAVTDDYGYDRKTGDSTIVHKGTDLHATEGTPVMAMNDGIVRVAQTFIVYGNAIIIDHGQGVQTLYMHLSKLNVKPGDTIKAGQIIGLSGKTGYAESPHLHISVKINKISIDPMTFLNFFQ